MNEYTAYDNLWFQVMGKLDGLRLLFETQYPAPLNHVDDERMTRDLADLLRQLDAIEQGFQP